MRREREREPYGRLATTIFIVGETILPTSVAKLSRLNRGSTLSFKGFDACVANTVELVSLGAVFDNAPLAGAILYGVGKAIEIYSIVGQKEAKLRAELNNGRK